MVSGGRENEGKTGTGDCRILVVDDDPYALRAIGGALSSRDYLVSVATDRRTASALMGSGRYDLMIAAEHAGWDTGKDPVRGAVERKTAGRLFSISRPIPTPGFREVVRLSLENCLSTPDELSEFLTTVDACLKGTFAENADTMTTSEAHSLDKEMLRLLMVMSHDTRGSLVAIGAGLKMLSRGLYGQMEETAAVKISELYTRTQDLALMAEEFLAEAFVLRDGSRMTLGRLDLRSEVVMPVLDELGGDLQDHRARVEAGLGGDLDDRLLVAGNKTCLKAVLRNLVRNAIDHGERGCAVSVGIEEEGSLYRLYVRNTGTAISSESRDTLFTPVRRLDFEDRRRSQGTGFGLYLVQEIVKWHGGKIWYEPIEQGSRFVFTLPRLECPPELVRDTAHETFSKGVACPDGLACGDDPRHTANAVELRD